MSGRPYSAFHPVRDLFYASNSMDAYVETLEEGSADPARLGGKGASLSMLVRLGFRVPPGCVVTAGAFWATLDHLGLGAALEELSAARAGGGEWADPVERIRRGIQTGRIPPDVLDPILRAIERLGLWEHGGGGLIVRSSATIEDSAASSFAGIFESIPITAADELEPAIRAVWLSGFSPRAIAYMDDRGVRGVPIVAVVVQPFLEASRSGVMFTRFIRGAGLPQILVEHVEGGCEKLVMGEVTPDRLWLSGPDDVPDDLEGDLAPAHARELARLAGDLEAVFGAPQDVEWLIHQGSVHLVQSRPITVGAVVAPPLPDESGGALRPAPVLTGVAASPGFGSGRVRLVFNIEQALALERGEVLVTPMTNPDMVVAMRSSTAIVTDVGGMICHAAIVSRELGLPCVVGTETATSVLRAGAEVTVDGWVGAIYMGHLSPERDGQPGRPIEWSDLWSTWDEATADREDLVPIVPTLTALQAAPPHIESAVLVPDVDLRSDEAGLWCDLEGLAPAERARVLDDYLARVRTAAPAVSSIVLLPLGGLSRLDLGEAVARSADPRIRLCRPGDQESPRPILSPGSRWPAGPAAVPLGTAALVRAGVLEEPPPIARVDQALEAALDTIKFFGHQPGVRVSTMPDPASRRAWWAILPEYSRFHAEWDTESEHGAFDWLEVRPELVISALLKSLVQPGFEMVPRILGFRDIGPMHIKWIKCRYHFRADSFARVWEQIVRMTWDEARMADLMRRVRLSYVHLEEVLRLFPTTDEELAATSAERVVALVTSWWPRWVEFFSLCWFIQAQGDDIAYPFIEETVRDNLARIGDPPAGISWPAPSDLVAPTTPVMSGEYMASVGRLRERLLAAGLTTREEAEAAMAEGRHPELSDLIQEHLRRWHWMRDRDLLFEPWDTSARVIETALKTEPHSASPYAENLRRNLLALGFHVDLAHGTGRAAALNRMTRFLHDLNVERENHHLLWLKYSYPLRRLCLEVERRLIAAGSLEPGDVFFLQAPELLRAARHLPAPLPDDLVARVKNRRAGYLKEARLAPSGGPEPQEEDDYY